ncbi:MAG: hypothetical protein QXT77_07555, partial [Candidatus Methanomethylicaceae archaeon]
MTDKKGVYKRLDAFGHEALDPTPVVVPAGFKRPETLAEQVQRLVRTHISRQAEEAGFETFEDAEDFDVDDDFDPSTPYEEIFDPVLGKGVTPDEFIRNEQRYRQLYLHMQKEADEAEARARQYEAVKESWFARRFG